MSSMKMSFSVRRKPELDAHMPVQIGRAASQRGGRPVTRTQISGPVALVSTTNMLSYNAPDIAGTKPVEHPSSSSEESDGSAGSVHSHETDPTDMSSPESSPVSPSPEQNHLSQYFKAEDDVKRSSEMNASPRVPRRAQSHSKRAHEALSRKRSVQRATSVTRATTRASVDMFSPTPVVPEVPREAPFVKEIAQLDAVAEEFTGARTENEKDAMWMRSRGLACFAAADYLNEISSLVTVLLDHKSPRVTDFSGWI